MVSAKLCTASENNALEPEKKKPTNLAIVMILLPIKASETDFKP